MLRGQSSDISCLAIWL